MVKIKKTLKKAQKDIRKIWRIVRLMEREVVEIEPSGKKTYGGGYTVLKYRCPVCNEEFRKSGVRSHMKQSAYREVYEWYNNQAFAMPHQNFLDEKKVELVET